MKSIPRFLPQWPIIPPMLWMIFGAWLGFLFYVSTRSSLIDHPLIPQQDKILHFVFFGCGAISFGAALRATANIRRMALFAIALISISAIGLADEINQLRIPGRSGGDLFDWLADFSGAACGLALLQTFYGRPKRNEADSGSPGSDSTA